jgi:hypothetical protein
MSEIKGILDNSTQEVVVLTDDKIILRGNVKIHGVLDVGLVKTTEIIADSRYEKKFLTFVSPDNNTIGGTGLLWVDKIQNKQLLFRTNPDCFFLSEHIDLPSDKSYMIGGSTIVDSTGLGPSITKSNLKELGTLKKLTVGGPVNIGDEIFYNPSNQRLSIGRQDGSGLFSIYDPRYDVEIILEGDNRGRSRIGSFGSKGLELITDNQTRIYVEPGGNINLGNEGRDNILTKVYGKLGINVKNPSEELEVSGNIKFNNRLFTTGQSAPEHGVYTKGDIVWNSDPMINNYVGWVCTTGGSPGIWAPFGLIAG